MMRPRSREDDVVVSSLAPLSVAVAQPACIAGEVVANARVHADIVHAASARVVVFPELSLTGYDLHDAPPVDPGSSALVPLVEACRATGSIAFAGAPVVEHGRSYIVMLAVDGSGCTVAYRKMYPGADETHRFEAGPAPALYDVDGWRVGLGICRDTGVPAHLDAIGETGVDVYVAGLVMHRHESAEQDARAARIARALHVPVAFASFAGPTGSGYTETAGCSGVWAADGTVIAQASHRPGDTAYAVLHP